MYKKIYYLIYYFWDFLKRKYLLEDSKTEEEVFQVIYALLNWNSVSEYITKRKIKEKLKLGELNAELWTTYKFLLLLEELEREKTQEDIFIRDLLSILSTYFITSLNSKDEEKRLKKIFRKVEICFRPDSESFN